MRELYDEANDESLFEDGAPSDNLLDDIDEIDVDDASMLQALRDSVRLSESCRQHIRFVYRGVSHEAVPIKEINPDKFIFNDVIEDRLFSAVLSEIEVEGE